MIGLAVDRESYGKKINNSTLSVPSRHIYFPQFQFLQSNPNTRFLKKDLEIYLSYKAVMSGHF